MNSGNGQGSQSLNLPEEWCTVFDDPLDDELFGMSGALEALGELERNTDEAIIAQRSSERLEIKSRVWVRPGNVSERHRFTVEGMTGDISNGGCQVLLPRPIYPGDIFWLEFDASDVHIGPLLARCLRCRLIREDALEVGFRFFQDVDLRNAIVTSQAASA